MAVKWKRVAKGIGVKQGSCLDVMADMPSDSVDSIVTDPPYELGFMGKAWDSSGIAYNVEVWAQCLRVLKPGGHLVAFGGTRMYHRMAVAIEDAGFEIRDSLHWIYGSGFPKGQNISKAIDKVVGANAATDEAKQWDGWNTALKPAHEPIVLARKPFKGTCAGNVLEHGTGAINVDGCRIKASEVLVRPSIFREDNDILGKGLGAGTQTEPGGRWPANILLSHLPECRQAGTKQVKTAMAVRGKGSGENRIYGDGKGIQVEGYGGFGKTVGYGDADGIETVEAWECVDGCPVAEMDAQSGASRFFPVFKYQAKANKKERPRLEDGTSHPTVKPLELMRWLIRLVTPQGGRVLDPFAGSGATGHGAMLEGMKALMIELDPKHVELIKTRFDSE